MGKTDGRQERDPYEEMARSFERNSVFCHMHSYDLYRQWLEATWAFMEAYRDRENFKQTLDKYTYEQGAEFGRLFGVYTDAVERMPFRDILGELFMRLDVKSAAAGQYFSPFPIAEMMARILFSKEDFEAKVREKGEVTVCDPAVGSGVMLLAYAKVVAETLGRPALRYVKFYGTDIDRRCVLMCRIQLRMNSLDTFGRMAGVISGLAGVSHAEAESTETGVSAPTGLSSCETSPTSATAASDSVQSETDETQNIVGPCVAIETESQQEEENIAPAEPDLDGAVILQHLVEAEEATAKTAIGAEQLTLF